MERNDKTKTYKGGRHPKKDPAVFRYSISFTAVENARFLSLFEKSGMNVKAHYITACVFQKSIKTIKIDKAIMDYYMRLTTLSGQFRAIGVNYNQIVKLLYRNFTEKKRLPICTDWKSKPLNWKYHAKRLHSLLTILKQNILRNKSR